MVQLLPLRATTYHGRVAPTTRNRRRIRSHSPVVSLPLAPETILLNADTRRTHTRGGVFPVLPRIGHAVLALALSAGCSDTPLDPNSAEALVIQWDDEGRGDAAVVAGDSIQLRASFQRGSRSDQAGDVEWSSEDIAIALVRAGGRVVGVGEGNVRVVARAGSLSDTVLVTVLAGPPAGGHCPAGGAGLQLAPGASYTTTAASAPELCITGPGEYVVVPFHASRVASTMQVEVLVDNPAALTAPADVDPPRQVELTARTENRPWAIGFDERLRALERRELQPLTRGASPAPGPAFALARDVVPAPGDVLTLNVNAEDTCTNPIEQRAEVVRVGTRSIIAIDLANPPGGFTEQDLNNLVDIFDIFVHPTITQNFGEPTDIDGNGRVVIVFTRAVNALTPRASESYTAGFFFARDLFPRTDTPTMQACATSNQGEILYLLAPDPMGEVNGNVRTRDFVMSRTPGVLAHEMQHLVNASRRIHVLGYEEWSEEFWLNEGLSHIAEELTFYTAASLAPRSEINLNRLRSGPATGFRFEQFQENNFNRFGLFLQMPETSSAISGSELTTRGAIWSFLRYAADHGPLPESELWKRLSEASRFGYENLLSALGTSPLTLMHDWSVALYADDNGFRVPPRFRQPSWNFRSILPSLTPRNPFFPLRVRDLRFTASAEERFSLGPAGSAFFRFSGEEGVTVTFRTTSGGAVPSPTLRLTVLRNR